MVNFEHTKKSQIGLFILVFILAAGCGNDRRSASELRPDLDTIQLAHAAGQIIVKTESNHQPAVSSTAKMPSLSQDSLYRPAEQSLIMRSTRPGQTMTLLFGPDSVRVWLNTVSQLDIPRSFRRYNRRIFLTGESLITVSSSDNPFQINLPGGPSCYLDSGEVFLSAYPDDQYIIVTFLHGGSLLLHLNARESEYSLRPGQSVAISHDGERITTIRKDTSYLGDLYIHSLFSGTADVYEVLRRIGRWYGKPIKYTGAVRYETFTGILPREKSLDNMLNFINNTMQNVLQCHLKSDTIYVSPQLP